MNRDVVSVRLWLPRTAVPGVVVDAPGRLVVRVGSTVRRPRCADCAAPGGTVHDRREKRVGDLEVSGRPTGLLWDRRRMVCRGCGRRFLEDHRALGGRVAARLARRLVADARETAVDAAARRHRVGWHTVMGLVIAYAVLSAFLASQGHRWQKGVKAVVSDGSKAYAAAIAERLGHARHVLDRFHVISGTRSASCTSSTSPPTPKAPSKRSTGPRTSTAPG